MKPYVVRAGDHLQALAAQRGCDPAEIWDHEKNRSLRELRGTGQILAPGDVVHLPDPASSRSDVRKGATNTFRGRVPDTTVRVTLRTTSGVLRNEACQARWDGHTIDAQTDGDGRLELTVPVTTKRVDVVIPGRDMTIGLRLGHLDPADEPAGAVQRLQALGYLFGYDPHEPEDVRRKRMEIALEAFQKDEGLPTSGQYDDATRQKLTSRHGV